MPGMSSYVAEVARHIRQGRIEDAITAARGEATSEEHAELESLLEYDKSTQAAAVRAALKASRHKNTAGI